MGPGPGDEEAMMWSAVFHHLGGLDREGWVIITCVSLIVAILVWLGSECTWMKRDIRSLQLRVRDVEATQKRLSGIVERGWSQSLDLTRIDWSRPGKGVT